MEGNNTILETKIYLETKEEYDDCEIEEIMEDYLPRVRAHIGFCDERSDKRFVVKFHDILYFTKTEGDEKDMEQEDLENLFEWFCKDMYDGTECVVNEECHGTMMTLMKQHNVGNYQAFEYIVENEITEENAIDVACEIYDEGLSPYYIDDYVKLVNHLKDMEDNYMKYWIEFLECFEDHQEAAKNIEKRWRKYVEEHRLGNK